MQAFDSAMLNPADTHEPVMGTTDIWDVVVVGSGMGGAMAAATLARGGLNTLILESGESHFGSPRSGTFFDKLKARIISKPKADPVSERWPDPLLVRSSISKPFRQVPSVVARLPGGSGQVYGAALARARRSDFEVDRQPGEWLKDAAPALPNAWPISYDEMRPYYQRAEAIFRVVGTRDALDPDDDAVLREPPPVSPAISQIARTLVANGRHPFRMHVGIDYLPGCKECQGERCARLCKSDSFNRALLPEIAEGRARFRTGASVERLERRIGGGYDIVVRSADGATDIVSARRVVLGGGALSTPLILQRSTGLWPSGKAPEIVGAGLMFHFSDIFAVKGMDEQSPAGVLKVLAFRDHYADGAMPLAECQSLGLPGSPWLISKYLEGEAIELGLGGLPLLNVVTGMIGNIAARIFRGAQLFTASVEDLPYLGNRVDSVGPSSVPGLDKVGVTYRAPAELQMRALRFRQLMREAFKPFSTRFFKRVGAPNLGHPMGTCRMGTNPETSVTTSDGSVWGHKDLYIVDASAFPSSLGINPALTVAANALRIAEAIVARCPECTRPDVLRKIPV